MRERWLPMLAIMLWIQGGESAHAEHADDSGYPAVEHASRLQQSLRDAPEAITVITGEELERWGITQIVDIFRYVPGMRISRRGAESRVAYHGTMLQQARRMEIMIDGQKVMIGDAAYVEFSRLPISLRDIKSVVIVRGPNGSAYGDNSFLATVDFVTKGGLDRSSSVAVLGGSQDTSVVTGTYAAVGKRYELSVTAERNRSDGYDEYQRGGSWYDMHDAPDTSRIHSRLDVSLPGGSLLEAALSGYRHEHRFPFRHQGNESSLPQNNDGAFYFFRATTPLDDRQSVSMALSHNSQNEQIDFPACIPQVFFVPGSFDVALYDQSKAYELLYTGDIAGGVPESLEPAVNQVKSYLAAYGASLYDDRCGWIINDRDSKRSEVEAVYRFSGEAIAIAAGASGTYYDLYSETYFDGAVYASTRRLFAQMSYELDRLTINAGAMAQYADYVDENAYDGRLSASWHFSRDLTLRLTRSHSERLPSLITAQRQWSYTNHLDEPTVWGLQVGRAAIVNLPPEHLSAESIDSNSIGLLGQVAGINVDLKLFYDEIGSPIVDTLDFRGAPVQNGDDYHLSGAEVAADYAWSAWRGRLAYSYLDNTSRNLYEQGLQSNNAGALTIERRLLERHNVAVSYVWNDAISGFTYDRIDVCYSLREPMAIPGLGLQFVLRHYRGGVDGRVVPIEGNYRASGYDSLTHYFVSISYDLP